MENKRICRTCNKEFPLTEEYFYRKDGRLLYHCKGCQIEKVRKSRAEALSIEYKECKNHKTYRTNKEKTMKEIIGKERINPNEVGLKPLIKNLNFKIGQTYIIKEKMIKKIKKLKKALEL